MVYAQHLDIKMLDILVGEMEFLYQIQTQILHTLINGNVKLTLLQVSVKEAEKLAVVYLMALFAILTVDGFMKDKLRMESGMECDASTLMGDLVQVIVYVISLRMVLSNLVILVIHVVIEYSFILLDFTI